MSGQSRPAGPTPPPLPPGRPPQPPAYVQPPPVQEKKGTSVGVIVAIIGAVLFLFVMILGIVAAIAIPNLLNAIQRGKQKRTMADIRSIAVACEAYAVDNNTYPSAETISDLRPLLEPKYIKVLPQKDAWESEFLYMSLDEDEEGRLTRYIIVSSGKDRALDEEYVEDYLPDEDGKAVETTNFNNDIAFSNGYFIRYPGFAR